MHRKDLIGVFAVALGIRFALFAISTGDPSSRQLEEDSHGYLRLAGNLLSEHRFGRVLQIPTAPEGVWVPELCRTPGYPFLLAMTQVVTKHGQAGVILLQHAAGILICIGAAVVCGKHFGRRAGLVAGYLLALDLQGTALGNLILTEVPYGFVVFGAVPFVVGIVMRPSIPLAAIAGVILGASALIRPVSIALPTVIAIGLLIHCAIHRRTRLIFPACVLAIAGNLVIGAWIVRNGLVCGEYTLSTIGRDNLMIEHAAGALARAQDLSQREASRQLAMQLGTDESSMRYLPMSASQDKQLKRLAFDTIREHKSAFLKDYLIRTVNTTCGPEKQILTVAGLDWINFGIHSGISSSNEEPKILPWVLLGAQILFLAAIYILVIRTLVLFLKRRIFHPLVGVSLLVALYILVLSSGSPGDPRMRWPAIPLLVMVAAASLARRETDESESVASRTAR